MWRFKLYWPSHTKVNALGISTGRPLFEDFDHHPGDVLWLHPFVYVFLSDTRAEKRANHGITGDTDTGIVNQNIDATKIISSLIYNITLTPYCLRLSATAWMSSVKSHKPKVMSAGASAGAYANASYLILGRMMSTHRSQK
jgi:hypothetical protein